MIKHRPVKNQFMEPNTTQTPNCFFDYYLKVLGEAELKITCVVIRHTYGWHEKDYRFALSLRELCDETGLARANVQRAALRLSKATEKRPAILGRKKAKDRRYIYWLLIHTAGSMAKGGHDTSTPENGEKTASIGHDAWPSKAMHHGRQMAMHHGPPKDKRKHVKTDLKTPIIVARKVPTGKRVKKHSDDDFNNALPFGSEETEPKISVPLVESSIEQAQVAVRPDSSKRKTVIGRNSSFDGKHDAAIVAKWCERLSKEFHWSNDRDGVAYKSVAHVRLEHILLGICYSVARARGHRFTAFSYAVPAILEEYSNSVRYGTEPEELTSLAAHHVAVTLTALKSGKWQASDYDEPEWANFKVQTRELAQTVLALTR